jgi:hypothetical protein
MCTEAGTPLVSSVRFSSSRRGDVKGSRSMRSSSRTYQFEIAHGRREYVQDAQHGGANRDVEQQHDQNDTEERTQGPDAGGP